MAPTWPQVGGARPPQVGTKIGQKSVPERSRERSRLRSRFLLDFGTIFGRFWDDFWSIFGTIFGRFLIQIPLLARNGKRVEFSIKSETLNIVEELQERITQEQGNLMCPI